MVLCEGGDDRVPGLEGRREPMDEDHRRSLSDVEIANPRSLHARQKVAPSGSPGIEPA